MTTLSTIRTFGWFTGGSTSISSLRTHGWFFDGVGGPGFVFIDALYNMPVEILATIQAEGSIPVEIIGELLTVTTDPKLPIEYRLSLDFFTGSKLPIEYLKSLFITDSIPVETLTNVNIIAGNNLPIDYIASILQNNGIPVEIIESFGIVVDSNIPIEIIEAAVVGTVDSYHLLPIEIIGGEQFWILDYRGRLWSITDCGLLWIRDGNGGGDWILPERN